MPPVVPIDRGFVFLLSEAFGQDGIPKNVLDAYVQKGCSTLLVGDNDWNNLSTSLLEVPEFESKAGKVAAYYGKHALSNVTSPMVEVCTGGLEEALKDETHKLCVVVVEKEDKETLTTFLEYHLTHPDRPHTPWVILVVPCPKVLHTRESVLSSLSLEGLHSGENVAAVAVSMCPDTCRVDTLTSFCWDAFISAAGGIALKPGDAVFELCYRVGLSPKFGD